MSRLQAEQQRLYFRGEGPDIDGGPDGLVRAMVLQVAGPGAWGALAPVWQGVQADLELAAPAIAVSGTDAYQLWFSLSGPVPVAQAASFLAGLRGRYLDGIAPARIRVSPAAGAADPALRLPPAQVGPERWSSFVTVDLAAVFGDEPWLDLPPTPDAQADLLSRVQSMQPGDLARALERLAPPAPAPASPARDDDSPRQDPRAFLLSVMNDPSVELKLRIEAARALLPGFDPPRP